MMLMGCNKSHMSMFLHNLIDSVLSAFLSGPDKFPPQCDVLLFCHDADRSLELNGRAYSPLIDSIREELQSYGLTCAVVAHPFSLLIGKKATGDPISLNRSHLALSIFGRFFNRHWFERHLYTKLFKHSRAKLVITIGCSEMLCYAARSLGILHLELLHGTGYSSIPWGWNSRECFHLPSAILSMDLISTKTFSSLSHNCVKIFTIPNPFLKRFFDENSATLPDSWCNIKPISASYLKRILITLQWGYAGDHGQTESYANILDNGLFHGELEKVIIKRQDIFWHFRLHPVQLRGRRYQYIRKWLSEFCMRYSNCEWQVASSVPLPSIAKFCSGTISMNSMSSYECAALGVPSLLLCPTLQPNGINAGMFKDLIDAGYAVKALPDSNFIDNWVCRTAPIMPRTSNLGDSASWFKAFHWMLKESGLDNVINSRYQ
jgi:hypothetical protein